MSTDQATIRTYATCANYLCLFDDAGLKTDLYVETTARIARNRGIVIQSTGKVPLPTDKTNFVYKIKEELFRDFGKQIQGGLVLSCNNVLKTGGLGISATSAVAFVELVNRLYGLDLKHEQKIYYASRGEPNNHLDNVLPCMLGGIVFSYRDEDEKPVKYERFDAPSNLFSALVIPQDIEKAGRTKGARDAIKELNHTDKEKQRISQLKKVAIEGVKNSNFQMLRLVASELMLWERSHTYERNKKGIYHINILAINRTLQRYYGDLVILTPSGAGTAMLIQAAEPEILKHAAKDVADVYARKSHKAIVSPVSIRGQSSIDDFVD